MYEDVLHICKLTTLCIENTYLQYQALPNKCFYFLYLFTLILLQILFLTTWLWVSVLNYSFLI